jgi:hypothetical protein
MLFNEVAMDKSKFSFNPLPEISIRTQCRPWRSFQDGRITTAIPSIVMGGAPAARQNWFLAQGTHLVMYALLAIILSSYGCTNKVVALDGEDTMQCKTDCVSVTKTFAYKRLLYEEALIRCEAELRDAQHKLGK